MCLFTRFRLGVFIPDKKAQTIAETLLHFWVRPMGIMQYLHTDRGSEFLNQELSAVCDYLGVKMTATAANTPNANGVCERNHAVVDQMLDKMLTADRNMKPEVALAWAVTAANSLDNRHGYSPAQLVFGRDPCVK